MIKDTVKSGRDVIRHLNDVLEWIGNAEIPEPLEIALKRGAVENGRILIGDNARFGDEGIGIAGVRRSNLGGWVNTKTCFGISPSIGDAEDAQKQTG